MATPPEMVNVGEPVFVIVGVLADGIINVGGSGGSKKMIAGSCSDAESISGNNSEMISGITGNTMQSD